MDMHTLRCYLVDGIIDLPDFDGDTFTWRCQVPIAEVKRDKSAAKCKDSNIERAGTPFGFDRRI